MKTVVLISGGFDSIAVYLECNNGLCEYDLIFFDYGQLYKDNEAMHAMAFASKMHRTLHTLKIHGFTDMINRNFIFLTSLKKLGYEEVYMGTRNIIPAFDKYKDSNWLSLKIAGWLFGIKVHLPIVGWSKNKVFKRIGAEGLMEFGYNCYSNKKDWHSCNCPNCIERRKLTWGR